MWNPNNYNNVLPSMKKRRSLNGTLFFRDFFYLFIQKRQANEKEKTIYECPLKDKKETTIYP